MEELETLCRARGGGRSRLVTRRDELNRAMACLFLVQRSRGYTFLSRVLGTEGPWTEATDESPRVTLGLTRLSARCSPIRAGAEGPPTCRG
jgi:hypothetical protein